MACQSAHQQLVIYCSHLYHSSKANCDCARTTAARIEIERKLLPIIFLIAHQLISERSIDDKIAGRAHRL
jgi:hypothetical protein